MKSLSTVKVLIFFFLFSIISFNSCQKDQKENETKTQPEVVSEKKPKYIFYFIGDGMSSPQINIAEAALADPTFCNRSLKIDLGKMSIRDLPIVGMQTTYAQDRFITGSAASATALATGVKTNVNTISMDASHTKKLETMAEMAKKKGMKVGVISSVSIDHATPACFYAHNEHRNNYQQIGQDLIASNFDYFAGGNVRHNKYKGYSLNQFISDAKQNGYQYIANRAEFDALDENSGKVIATIEKLKTFTSDGCALPYHIDLNSIQNPNDNITLAEFTQKGIDVLDNDKGFFLMVEGGKIDWACHANDVVSTVYDMIAFDNALAKALQFYAKHPDETLIVCTGDHECGGLSLGFSATKYQTCLEVLKYQKASYLTLEDKVNEWEENGTVKFEDALIYIKETFGLGNETLHENLKLNEYDIEQLRAAFERSMTGESTHKPEEVSVIYGAYDPFTVTVTHILNNKAGISWTTYSHTGTPVPVFAKGVGAQNFCGYYDNTDIAKKIISIAELGS
ncbi:MAG: alkaline phosphatase [Bacteroidales bacterium]